MPTCRFRCVWNDRRHGDDAGDARDCHRRNHGGSRRRQHASDNVDVARHNDRSSRRRRARECIQISWGPQLGTLRGSGRANLQKRARRVLPFSTINKTREGNSIKPNPNLKTLVSFQGGLSIVLLDRPPHTGCVAVPPLWARVGVSVWRSSRFDLWRTGGAEDPPPPPPPVGWWGPPPLPPSLPFPPRKEPVRCEITCHGGFSFRFWLG